MNLKTISLFLAVIAAYLAAPLKAQDLFVYPQKGQSAAQQDKDQYECYQWARQNTGVDPQRPPPATQSNTGDQAARGAVRGALGGLAIANIAGGSGSKGAAAGAIFGGLGGASRSNRQQQAQQQQSNQAMSQYNRAYAACLNGRGYTVK